MTAPKVDLSEFYRLSRPKKPPCQIGHVLTQLKAPEPDQLQAAMAADPGIITPTAIQQWLAVRKHDVSIPAIGSHRKRTCSCGRA